MTDEVKAELEPCPFCPDGGDVWQPAPLETIRCSACGAAGPRGKTDDEIVAAWNTRASSPATGDVISRAEAVAVAKIAFIAMREFGGASNDEVEYYERACAEAAKQIAALPAVTGPSPSVSLTPTEIAGLEEYLSKTGTAFRQRVMAVVKQQQSVSQPTPSVAELIAVIEAYREWLEAQWTGGERAARNNDEIRLWSKIHAVDEILSRIRSGGGRPRKDTKMTEQIDWKRVSERLKCPTCGDKAFIELGSDGTWASHTHRFELTRQHARRLSAITGDEIKAVDQVRRDSVGLEMHTIGCYTVLCDDDEQCTCGAYARNQQRLAGHGSSPQPSQSEQMQNEDEVRLTWVYGPQEYKVGSAIGVECPDGVTRLHKILSVMRGSELGLERLIPNESAALPQTEEK